MLKEDIRMSKAVENLMDAQKLRDEAFAPRSVGFRTLPKL